MKCLNCGFDTNSNFCERCGAPVNNSNGYVANNAPQKGNKTNLVLIIVISLLAITAIVLLFVVIFSGNSKTETESSTNKKDSEVESKVNEYIQNSRKSAMVDTASSFIDSVRTKVNEARVFAFFDTEVLYLVAVGEDDGEWKSCIRLYNGKSPFGSWEEAYVGVTYDGRSYNYYFYGLDSSGHGINLASEKDMSIEGSDLVTTDAVKWNAESCDDSSCNTMRLMTKDALALTDSKSIEVIKPNASGSCTYKTFY